MSPSLLDTTHPASQPGWLLLHFLLPLGVTFAAYSLAFRLLRGRFESDKAASARIELFFYFTITGITIVAAIREWPWLGALRYVNDLTAFGMAYIIGFFAYELTWLEKRRAHVMHHVFFIALFAVMLSRPYYYGIQPLFVLFETFSIVYVITWLKRDSPRSGQLFVLNLYVHAFSLGFGPMLLGFIALTATAHDGIVLGLTIAGVLGNAATIIERLARSVDRLVVVPAGDSPIWR